MKHYIVSIIWSVIAIMLFLHANGILFLLPLDTFMSILSLDTEGLLALREVFFVLIIFALILVVIGTIRLLLTGKETNWIKSILDIITGKVKNIGVLMRLFLLSMFFWSLKTSLIGWKNCVKSEHVGCFDQEMFIILTIFSLLMAIINLPTKNKIINYLRHGRNH